MNDFTKEELIWLYEDIGYGLEEHQQPDIAYRIYEKLKSMIDNYCDHEYFISGGKNNVCHKCGKIL
jgi:hypothetical protein